MIQYFWSTDKHPIDTERLRLQGFSDVSGSGEAKKIRGAGAESTAQSLNMGVISKKIQGKNDGTYNIQIYTVYIYRYEFFLSKSRQATEHVGLRVPK